MLCSIVGPHFGLQLVAFVSIVFLPAFVLWFFALSVWIANKRPEMSVWRAATFKWGLISGAAAMALLAPASARILTDQVGTPLPLIWGILNLLGVLLWLISFGAAFTGKRWGRALLLVSGLLTVLAVFAIDIFGP